MDLWEMRREISRANNTLSAADEVANQVATLLPGRLRHVSGDTLKKLKMELKDFNAHTFQWKENK